MQVFIFFIFKNDGMQSISMTKDMHCIIKINFYLVVKYQVWKIIGQLFYIDRKGNVVTHNLQSFYFFKIQRGFLRTPFQN